jgi:hypothetical protein
MKAFQTKWGMIKHNVVKCVKYYGIIMALSKLGTSIKDVFQMALESFKSRRPKNQRFVFIHC